VRWYDWGWLLLLTISILSRLSPRLDRFFDRVFWRYVMLLLLPVTVVLWWLWCFFDVWSVGYRPEYTTLRRAISEVWKEHVRNFWRKSDET
jgi:hypothetical protein